MIAKLLMLVAVVIAGKDAALKQGGSQVGNSYQLQANGYLGTYVTVTQPGPVTVKVTASGGSKMGIALGDKFQEYQVAQGAGYWYPMELNLPVGTHFLRVQAEDQLVVSSLEVIGNGVGLANVHNNTNAGAAAESYIANYRKGDARLVLPQVGVGEQVKISLKRHDRFDFGAAIHHADHLNNANYRRLFEENFTSVSTGGPGYWLENEEVRDVVTISELERVVDYAREKGMRVRGHNLIYERDQPNWTKSLTGNALKGEITERINYYLPLGYDDLDVYNESYNGGQLGGSGTYWNRLGGAAGVAAVMNESEAKHPETRMFVNDYAVLQGAVDGWAQHVDSLVAAGAPVEGIGLEYYAGSGDSNLEKNFQYGLAAMQTRGKPIVLSEFGLFEEAAGNPQVLGRAMKMIFGNPMTEGFLMWDWTNHNEWSFADGSVLWKRNGSGGYAITPSGQEWQRLMREWDTELTLTANAQGEVSFNGFYGTYEVTYGGLTRTFEMKKGREDYVLFLPGDFNQDGVVDAADYTVWRDFDGNPATYLLWKENYGLGAAQLGSASVNTVGGMSRSGLVPEAGVGGLVLALLVTLPFSRSMASYTSPR